MLFWKSHETKYIKGRFWSKFGYLVQKYGLIGVILSTITKKFAIFLRQKFGEIAFIFCFVNGTSNIAHFYSNKRKNKMI